MSLFNMLKYFSTLTYELMECSYNCLNVLID